MAATGIFVIGFILSMDLNPDKKQNIRETLKVIKKEKKENTLVIVSPFDFLPSFAYHYNREAFSSVGDNREYYLTDSLLRAKNIFLVNSIQEIQNLDIGRYQQVIFLGIGKSHDIADNLQLKNFILNDEQILFDRYFLKTYTK